MRQPMLMHVLGMVCRLFLHHTLQNNMPVMCRIDLIPECVSHEMALKTGWAYFLSVMYTCTCIYLAYNTK